MSNKKANKIYMKYASYNQYNNLNSTDFLMLCEFLDNSISSFIRSKNNSYQNLSGCKINIIIDDIDKKNRKLIIEDNGLGIEEKVLSKCLEIGNQPDHQKDSELNAYGVGMKQAAFFLGKSIHLLTKSGMFDYCQSTFIEVNSKNLNDVVELRIDDLFDQNNIVSINGEVYTTGTIVKISFLRSGNFSLKKFHEEYKKLIGARYYEYLNSGLEIDFYSIRDKKIHDPIKIEKNRASLENVNSYVNNKNFNYSSKEEFKKEIIKIVKTINGDMKARDNLISIITDERDFVWNFSANIVDKYKVKGQIGWLANPKNLNNDNQSLVKYFGFNIYQAGRAIYSAPTPDLASNDNAHQGTYKKELFTNELSGQTNHERRWTGYLDISELVNVKDDFGEFKYLKPDSNKRGLKWVDYSAYENFRKLLKAEMDKYDIYLKSIVLFFTNSLKKENISTTQGTGSLLNKDLNPDFINVFLNDNKTADFKIINSKGKDFNVKIKLSDNKNDINKENIIDMNYLNDDERTMGLTVNPSNRMWTPIMDNGNITNENATHFYKLVLVFALTNLLFVDKKIECNLFDEIFNKKISKLDYIEKDFIKLFSIVNNLVFSKGYILYEN